MSINERLFDSCQIRQETEFLRALNAAAATIQQAAYSDTAVYQAFQDQIPQLNLHGSISLVDESGEFMQVQTLALSKRLLNIIEKLEKITNINFTEYRYVKEKAGLDNEVMEKRRSIFLPDNSKKMLEIMPDMGRVATELMIKVFTGIPAVLAPIFLNDCAGVLYVAGEHLSERDVPAVAAFANHMSIALQNAQLFQDMQRLTDELAAQTSMFNAILATTPDNFTVMDRDGRYLYVSPQTLPRLGLDQLVGKTWRDLGVPTEIGQKGDQERKQVLQTGQPLTSESRLPFQNGFIDIEYTLNPMRGSNNEIVGIVTTIRDITQRKRKEEALRQAQKNESLGILAGGVAHDFNNLLVGMLGQTSLALAKAVPDSPAVKHIEKAVAAAEKASHLTRQLLAYSGRGQFLIRPLNLNQLIDDNYHLFKVALPKLLTLNLNLNASLPLIDADLGQIQQVVMNLIINAAEAIGDQQGTILIATDSIEITKDDNIYWQRTNESLEPGQYILLEMHDDGNGMNDETLKTIFDPFFSTKFTGRGLGLAAVLGIMRGHKGGLSVSSRVNVGTVFRLVFPVSTDVPAELPFAQETAVSNMPNLVLVIDDEESVRDALEDILESEGVQVITAVDGIQGVMQYQAMHQQIGLVILDLSMPGMDGKETFNQLVEINSDVQVLLLSGYHEEEVRHQFTNKLKPVGFIQKPFRIKTLLDTISQHIKT
ncbi:MAG: response regulator [Chloroflexi bacterium]|nr:response regulator [Chloroflexota bacterium]